MKSFYTRCLFVTLVTATGSLCAAEPPHHSLRVDLQPEQHRVVVKDTVTLVPESKARVVPFQLHAGLRPQVSSPQVGLEFAGRMQGPVPLEVYNVTVPANVRSFTLSYGGVIDHSPQAEGAAAVRGELSTAGSISPQGVFLAASTAWFPLFDTEMVTFDMSVHSPRGWEAISQGRRTLHETDADGNRVGWEISKPQDDIYLVAAPFTEYDARAAHVALNVFLREPDRELARRYLDAAGPYIGMYERLIGPYPYDKFALVENFWETGYGMPSFTLMGSRVIRFPFIVYSSFPHEILHNWWGNGVFVDYEKGNWSEGLTAYLSDHLLQEQRDKAVDYRRTTLQKYKDYVATAEDFPLTAFRSRGDNASEAIGYGKALMFFHMLRRQLGDDVFVAALRAFYRDNVFHYASFDDLRRAFEKASGADLKAVFAQWVTRTGAPALTVANTRTVRHGDGYQLQFDLRQRQDGPAYRLAVPVAITVEGRDTAVQKTVDMGDKRQTFTLDVTGRPVRLDVDPQFDLFRRLDSSEVPPALSQLFGAQRLLVVLPGRAPAEIQAGYRQLAEAWSQPGVEMDIRLDTELTALPTDRAVWVFGWENRFRGAVVRATSGFGVQFGASEITIDAEQPLTRTGNSAVLVSRQTHNPQTPLAWLGSDNPAAFPGLARKLPHYGKYSYLGFSGDDPTNTVKGSWTVQQSALSVPVVQPDGSTVSAKRAALAPRRPLIGPN